jgi:hypothetical protein
MPDTPTPPVEYIVIRAQIVGDQERGYDTAYNWDGRRCPTAQEAIDFGWRLLDHDDFNIGHVQGERLMWFGWMHEEHRTTAEELAEIAGQIGLSNDAEVSR